MAKAGSVSPEHVPASDVGTHAAVTSSPLDIVVETHDEPSVASQVNPFS
jgi:hypothetical protein